jgi:CRP-like cAMP-binding protein
VAPQRPSGLVNRVFAGLPAPAQDRLRPYLERVSLPKDRVLLEAGGTARYAYFPMSGLVSWQALTDDGHAFDVAVVGNEGLIGATIVLPRGLSAVDLRVQLPGEADRVRADAVLREFRRGEEFQQAVLSHVHDVLFQMVQSAVCAHAHPLSQRLCRWLLLARDALGADTIELTQEAIALILGFSRPKVSVALALLEDQQLIRQRHGRLQIVNPGGLAHASCLCHDLDRARRLPHDMRAAHPLAR